MPNSGDLTNKVKSEKEVKLFSALSRINKELMILKIDDFKKYLRQSRLNIKSSEKQASLTLEYAREQDKRLTELCKEATLTIANTFFQQHERRLHMDITRWSTPKSD